MTSAQRRILVLVSAFVAGSALFPFTARPLTWDEITYMDLAFHPSQQAWVLNRYAHVYAMMPFMALTGDPYVGARAFWCCLAGISVGAIVDAALRLPAGERARVLALSLFLLLGQVTLFRSPGVPYADYTVMAVVTVSVCTALRCVLENRWTPGVLFLLGALFFFGFKSKEAALPLLLLPALLFLTPSGFRFDRNAVRLGVCWALGALGVAVAMIGLDALFLGDPLFSVRPSSWVHLLGYNLRPEINEPSSDTWLGLMLRESSPSFALYLIAGPIWLLRKRDSRLAVLYLFPVLFLLMLAALRGSVAMGLIARYTIPILPIHCFLAALAFWQAAAHVRWQEHLRWVALTVLLVVGVKPAWSVATSLFQRHAKHAAEIRFAGFYEVARKVDIEPDARIFVTPRLYHGAIRPRALLSLARMNFNRSLPRSQIVTEGSWKRQDVDYAVLTSAQYEKWKRKGAAVDAEQTLTSSDGAVVLVCLRAPCTR